MYVVEAIAEGRVSFDEGNDKGNIQLPIKDDDLLRLQFARQVFELLTETIVRTFPSEHEEDTHNRINKVHHAISNWNHGRGNKNKSDRQYLLRMMEIVLKGHIPAELYKSADSWRDLKCPDVELAPIAEIVLGNLANRAGSDSVKRRLVRKFREQYQVLIAVYMIEDQFFRKARAVLDDLSDVFEKHGVLFKT